MIFFISVLLLDAYVQQEFRGNGMKRCLRIIDINKTADCDEETEIINQLKQLLLTSINRRLRSDVPVGSSLSGGLDSSIVVALIDKIDAERNIHRKTFSACFPGFKKDEKEFQDIV